jgi:hypothetical protein
LTGFTAPIGNGAGDQVLADRPGDPSHHLRRSHKLTYMPWSAAAVLAPPVGNGNPVTWLYCLPVDDDVTALRLIFARPPGGPAWVIAAAAATASSTANDYVNPTGGAPPSTVTWNNEGAESDVPAPFNSHGDVTMRVVPGAPSVDPMWGSKSVWTPDLTDWIPIVPAPRTGARTSYLMVRILTLPQPLYRAQAGCAHWTGDAAVNRGHDLKISEFIGDAVTGFPVIAKSSLHPVGGPLMAYQVLSRTLGITVAAAGDSKIDCTSPVGMNGFLNQIWGTWPGPEIFAPCFCSWGGRTSDTFDAIMSYLLPVIEPRVLFIQAFTILDPIGSMFTAAFPRALMVARRAIKLGAVPVLIGPYPDTQIVARGSDAMKSAWRAAITEIRTMARSGTLVLDPAAICGATDPAGELTGAIIPAFDADGQHLNHAGQAAIAAVAQQMISSMART